MNKGSVYIGTSGWHYKHWKGTFYPSDIKDSEQFSEFIKHFDTVELNNSFYMLPTAKTFENWREAAPPDFIFSVKASRYFTHMKKLIVDKASIRKFFLRASRLHEKLGAVLFQLPPKWKINADRFAKFLIALPKGYRYTFEFREHSWYHESIYELLRQHGCAFCIYELEHHMSPIEVTTDFVYIRLHGPGNKYQGSYSDEILQEWANRIKQWRKKGVDTYIYFDNDQEGYAAFNAKTLLKMM